MKLRLDHIGFVVEKIDGLTPVLEALGFDTVIGPEPDPVQKVSASFVKITNGEDVYLEMLEPTAQNSPISKFLEGRGGGLHHLCFEVDDIEDASRRLGAKGFKTVCEPVDCVAYDTQLHGPCERPTRVAFFIVSDRFLLELIEKGK